MALPTLTLPPPQLYLSSCPPYDFSPPDPRLLLCSKGKTDRPLLEHISGQFTKCYFFETYTQTLKNTNTYPCQAHTLAHTVHQLQYRNT